jgi:galactofuranosylgalactofuranosylrhamnosyl-N-acetylglucosaminyl-diphospho-decaprenol beta-1,5/1,6-galactofuranosyltransferase
VHRLRKEYPDAVVLPAASALPAPLNQSKAMKPPVNPLTISYRLARGILHNLTEADPESHQRPEFNVPTQDARWFRLCTVDGVTVTTADGCGVVYRQRDRAKMFSLLLQSLRRQRQLLSRFDEMRRIYRGALPVLSSKQKWETVLLPAAESRHG